MCLVANKEDTDRLRARGTLKVWKIVCPGDPGPPRSTYYAHEWTEGIHEMRTDRHPMDTIAPPFNEGEFPVYHGFHVYYRKDVLEHEMVWASITGMPHIIIELEVHTDDLLGANETTGHAAFSRVEYKNAGD